MNDIDVRIVGTVGRITLNRPQALNAVTLPMIRAMAEVLPLWAEDDAISVVVIDAAGDKAFSAGGDIADIYAALTRDEYETARQFWREEYPLNATLSHYPKPLLTFLQGFTMGGGVGLGCHANHRIVGDTAQIAMPECGIGLVPDVGGSLLLANAPGHVGEFIGTTAYRMGPSDAIFAGFADHYIPEDLWPKVISELELTGRIEPALNAKSPPPDAPLQAMQAEINRHFNAPRFSTIVASLEAAGSDFAATCLAKLRRHAPLAMAATVTLIRHSRTLGRIEDALTHEYRFAHRIAAQGDFREGIRAAIIDKDRNPIWAHRSLDGPTEAEVDNMLAPLGAEELMLGGTE